MSQFITIQVGQCGNQIGSAFWPLVLHEYGIQTTSSEINFLKTQKNYNKNINDLCDAFNSFFYVPKFNSDLAFKTVSELVSAKVKARAVLIDMEDSVVARFKQGPLRNLFDQTCTVTNYPGSANNWAVGYHTHGGNYHDEISETIRKTVEKCDCLHGFLITHSLGGGTGSGLGTATLKILADNYNHVDRFVSCVYPAGTEDVITSPYNVLLATKQLTDFATCVFPAENKALQDICYGHTKKKENSDQAKYNASCRPFQDMNSIIVNMLLHLTSGSRFSGSLNTDMNELATNLVPYPNLHYIFSSVSPATLTAPAIAMSQKTRFLDELFTTAWSRNNQMIKADPFQTDSVILGAAHIVRGDTALTDIRKNISRFQSKVNFTEWSKEVMKVGLCSVPPAGHPVSLLSLINSTSMSSMLLEVIRQFDKLYKKKAHVHHYLQVDNFEEDHFRESRNSAINVYEGYMELQNQKPINEPRLRLI